jgi:hypothetical protein
MSILSELKKAMDARVWEMRHPIPGLRHNSKTILVPHRFPVKGGLTWVEAMQWDMYNREHNSELRKLLGGRS